MIDEMLAFINGNPIKTLDVQISEQTTALEGSIDTMQSGLQSKIDDMSDYLAEYLLQPSSEVYLETDIGFRWEKADGTVSNASVPGQIVFKTSGTVTLSFVLKKDYNASGSMRIYHNGVQVASVSPNSSAQTVNVAVSKSGVITFKYSATNNEYSGLYLELSNVNVLATPVYARTLNLIEVEG